MLDATQARLRMSDIWILAAGTTSAVLTLLAVYLLSKADKDFAIMGWYAMFVIPAGAIAVGLAAGSGFGLVSWLSGRKMSIALLAIIFILLFATYGAAQWIEFNKMEYIDSTGHAVGFFSYYDATTRAMTFKMRHSSSSSGPLGALGYLFRLLEIIGFSAGGLSIPLILRSQPYCDACQSYMRKRTEWWIPASIPERKVNKKDAAAMAAYALEMQQADEKGSAALHTMLTAAQERNSTQFTNTAAACAITKKPSGLWKVFSLSLKTCAHCANGLLIATSHIGKNDKATTKKIASQPVDAGFVQSLPQVAAGMRAKT